MPHRCQNQKPWCFSPDLQVLSCHARSSEIRPQRIQGHNPVSSSVPPDENFFNMAVAPRDADAIPSPFSWCQCFPQNPLFYFQGVLPPIASLRSRFANMFERAAYFVVHSIFFSRTVFDLVPADVALMNLLLQVYIFIGLFYSCTFFGNHFLHQSFYFTGLFGLPLYFAFRILSNFLCLTWHLLEIIAKLFYFRFMF